MELWVTAIASVTALILCAWRGSTPILARLTQLLNRAASSPVRAVLVLIAIAAVIYPLPSLLWRTPTPVIHDEFGYLLQGDTFAHGRLTNDPHPMHEFFETFHILQQPTYAAKFPPGPGMTLALGYVLGLPLIGNWLMLLVGACVIYWMMRAVLPSRWALLVAILTIVHPTVLWFSQTYWGGAVALAGGALLGGAVIRGIKTPSFANGLIAGSGMMLLMFSRPFEGSLVSIACGVAMLICAFRDGMIRPLLFQFASASLILPAIGACGLMYYNWRVTGNPTLLPYVLHTQQYMAAPLFYWKPIPPLPVYPNEQIRSFYTGIEFSEYSKYLHWPDYLFGMFDRAGIIIWAYLRSLLLIVPLVIALFWTRGRIVVMCVAICVAVLALHVTVSPWMRPAYMAPLMGLLLIPISLGLRQLYVWRLNGQPIGRAMVRAIIITQLFVGAFELSRNAWSNAHVGIAQRDQIIRSLEQQGGRHLILVQYSPGYTHEAEWVYNAADIDASPVIFARDLGEETDQKLLDYYHDRKMWIVKVAPRNATLKPLDQPDDSTISPPLRPVVSSLPSR